MLYVTTRNYRDAYTAQRVLREDRGPDGGLFLPFRMPAFSENDLEELFKLPFTLRIAQILNGLLGTKITQWDVDFCVGRHPVRLVALPQKIRLVQCWHNAQQDLAFMVRALASRLRQDRQPLASDWTEIAVRIALLFAVFGELWGTEPFSDGKKVDIAVLSGEFYGPVSAWYARLWGLPVGSIVCCCNENSQVWELFHRGQLRTDAVTETTVTPDGDVALPVGLERLIFAAGGEGEVARYLEAVRRGGTYCPNELVQESLRRGMYVSVVSRQRMETTLRSVYAATGTILSPYDGLCHGGLLDYRARAGENRQALVLSGKSPILDKTVTAAAFGIEPGELERRIREEKE